MPFQSHLFYIPDWTSILPSTLAVAPVLGFSCPFVWNASPHAPSVSTLPGEHLPILQCPIPTPPPPLFSLRRHKLPHFRGLTKMDKTSEDSISHHLLNSALTVTMESDLLSQVYHIWSLSPLVHSAPAALYWGHEFVSPARLHIFQEQGRNVLQLCEFHLLAQSLQGIPNILVEEV